MADGVYGIGSGNTSGINAWYLRREKKNEDVDQENAQNQEQVSYTKADIDESKVWAFMANNSAFSQIINTDSSTEGVNFDVEGVTERMEDWMPKFEEFYAIIEAEVGAALAPLVMDLVMDKLMGMY